MIKKCKYCGTEFETKGRSLYCSDACRLTGSNVRPLKKKPKVMKICPCCGVEFESRINNHKFCTKECYNKSLQSEYKPKVIVKKPKHTIEEIQRMARAEGLTYAAKLTFLS